MRPVSSVVIEPQFSILSEQHHDSPYRDAASSSKPSSSRRSSGSKRATSRPQTSKANGHGHSRPKVHANGAGRASPAPNGRSHGAPALAASNGNGTSNGRKRRRRGGKGVYRQSDELTSHPTTRNAYVGTREWLLAQHGPVCAYCGLRFAPDQMTLDHVAPRRGQTAYDRRDNLVLACQPCNGAKRDLAPLAFLLGNRSRARNLVRFGEHLSAGLIDLARSLLPPGFEPEEDSPYKD